MTDIQNKIMSDSFLSSGAKVTALWLLKNYGSLEKQRGDMRETPEGLDIHEQTFRKHVRELIARGYRKTK